MRLTHWQKQNRREARFWSKMALRDIRNAIELFQNGHPLADSYVRSAYFNARQAAHHAAHSLTPDIDLRERTE